MKSNGTQVLVSCLITFVLFANSLAADPHATQAPTSSVYCSKGNIVYVATNGAKTQLTNSGLDTEPTLSLDGQRIAFVRMTPDHKIDGAFEGMEANEIWIVDVEGKNAWRIVQGRADPTGEDVLTGLASPAFSPDGKIVYFLSSSSPVSSAIHRVVLENLKVSFVAAGNTLEVVKRGKYKGCLITEQHRYWIAGGSYDWYWLLTPDGKDVGPIGEERAVAGFRDYYGK